MRILLAFIDYKRKVCGLGPIFTPSGDIEADMKKIREFYAPIEGKYPEKQGKIEVAPRGNPPKTSDQSSA